MKACLGQITLAWASKRRPLRKKKILLDQNTYFRSNKLEQTDETRHGSFLLISTNSYIFRTGEFLDKTPQIDEEILVMMMDKAKETKLQRYKS